VKPKLLVDPGALFEVKPKLLVDTDILIDVSKGIELAVNRLQSEANNSILAISMITQMELMVGCRNKTELQNLEKFLRWYVIIKVNELISDKAIELLSQYRLNHGLLIPDGLIAATSIVINAPLLSKNQRDYRFISELNLLSYP
jgi:predicted nucleic acid-binding protein